MRAPTRARARLSVDTTVVPVLPEKEKSRTSKKKHAAQRSEHARPEAAKRRSRSEPLQGALTRPPNLQGPEPRKRRSERQAMDFTALRAGPGRTKRRIGLRRSRKRRSDGSGSRPAHPRPQRRPGREKAPTGHRRGRKEKTPRSVSHGGSRLATVRRSAAARHDIRAVRHVNPRGTRLCRTRKCMFAQRLRNVRQSRGDAEN